MLNCHNQHSTLMNNSDKESISPNNNNSSMDVAPNTRKSTRKTFKRAFLSDEQSHMQNESKLNDNIDEYYEFGEIPMRAMMEELKSMEIRAVLRVMRSCKLHPY